MYIKFPKDTVCSEEYGVFDLLSFGYMYKSLSDLTTETTLEQKTEKLREEITSM